MHPPFDLLPRALERHSFQDLVAKLTPELTLHVHTLAYASVRVDHVVWHIQETKALGELKSLTLIENEEEESILQTLAALRAQPERLCLSKPSAFFVPNSLCAPFERLQHLQLERALVPPYLLQGVSLRSLTLVECECADLFIPAPLPLLHLCSQRPFSIVAAERVQVVRLSRYDELSPKFLRELEAVPILELDDVCLREPVSFPRNLGVRIRNCTRFAGAGAGTEAAAGAALPCTSLLADNVDHIPADLPMCESLTLFIHMSANVPSIPSLRRLTVVGHQQITFATSGFFDDVRLENVTMDKLHAKTVTLYSSTINELSGADTVFATRDSTVNTGAVNTVSI